MVNLTCPNDGKGTDLQYELVVHAEIYSPEQDEAPEIPEVEEKDTTQLAVSTVGEVRSTVYSTAINLIDKTTKGGFPATTKIALTGFLTAPFLGIDILLSSKEEGVLQATITGTTATLATMNNVLYNYFKDLDIQSNDYVFKIYVLMKLIRYQLFNVSG